MRICKRITAFAAIVLALAALFPVHAAAAGAIETERPVSLTISHSYNGQKLKNVTFKLYQVADVNACGELDVLPEFSAYAAELDIRGKNDDAWREITQKLEDDILAGKIKGIKPIQLVTDKEGVAKSSGDAPLKQGLYLILSTSTKVSSSVYSTAPFMVMLPNQGLEKNEWVYELAINTKPGIKQESKPGNPGSGKPSGKLPQTGQLNWPVPVLAAGGLLLMIVGYLLQREKKRHET